MSAWRTYYLAPIGNDTTGNGSIVSKSYKLSCRTVDYSNITLKGIIFKSFIYSFDHSSIDLNNCEVGMSSIIAFDEANVKTTSIDVTDIYAFGKSVIHYRIENQAFVMEKTNKASIKKDLLKNIKKNNKEILLAFN